MRIENLRRQSRYAIRQGNPVSKKEFHNELYQRDAYNDRNTFILGAYMRDEQGRRGRTGRGIRRPINPFPDIQEAVTDRKSEGIFNSIWAAFQQEKRVPADQRITRYDVNQALPGLEEGSNFGNPTTIPIRIGKYEYTEGKIDVPIWSRNNTFDI